MNNINTNEYETPVFENILVTSDVIVSSTCTGLDEIDICFENDN